MQTTILVVEHNPVVCELLDIQLRYAGYRVFVVHCAEDALVVLGSLHVDLVITAILLPDMGGAALITTMKERHLRMPVVVISTVKNTGELDVEAYLRKPYHLAELQERVRSLTRVPQLV